MAENLVGKERFAAIPESVNGKDWKGELQASPSEPFISLIMCSRNPDLYQRTYNYLGAAVDFVPMIGQESMAKGYNVGAAQAASDILVFTHDDTHLPSNKTMWVDLINQLKVENSGVAGVVGYRAVDGKHWLPIQFGSGACMHSEGTQEWLSTFGNFGETIILDGIFLAMTRKVFDDIGGFDEDYPGWHFYDIDISFRAYMKGYRNFTFPLKVTHDRTKAKKVNPKEWREHERIFMSKWGDKLPKTLQSTTDKKIEETEAKPAEVIPAEKEAKVVVAQLNETPETQYSMLKHSDFNRVLSEFHFIYYHGQNLIMGTENIGNPMTTARWMGLTIHKCPMDMWVYQEILFETRPDLIIEAGTGSGASALYLAQMCDILDGGRVVTIDIHGVKHRRPHPRLSYLVADICHPETLEAVNQIIASFDGQPRVMIIFDDDHKQAHVEEEMEMWCHLVSPGCYMIVEDTNVNGHPVFPDHGPGPHEAVQTFMAKHDEEFYVDYNRQKFLMSCHPGGFLRRL
jgi:cephalosporin hydroxylase